MMIDRSVNIGNALRRRQRGFFLNPFRFAASGGTDPSFANVALLLHMEGVHGGTTFSDNSANGFTAVSTGGVTNDTSQSKFGVSSVAVNGGSGAGIKYSDNAAFTLGGNPFVVEMFARFADTGTQRFLSAQADSGGSNTSISYAIQRTAADKIRAFVCVGSGTAGDITSSSSVTSGVWYYIAYGRDSGDVFRLFIDAAAEGTSSPGAITVNNSADQLGIGSLGARTTLAMSGYIDEFRLTVGAYRDIATIGVPTQAFPNS